MVTTIVAPEPSHWACQWLVSMGLMEDVPAYEHWLRIAIEDARDSAVQQGYRLDEGDPVITKTPSVVVETKDGPVLMPVDLARGYGHSVEATTSVHHAEFKIRH